MNRYILPRNSRKTEFGAISSGLDLVVRAAPFAPLRSAAPAVLTGLVCLGLTLFLGGCGNKVDASAKDTAPPAATVEHEENSGLVKVDHPDQFPLVAAGERMDTPELNTTGSVNPDVARNIPVISMASGRVVEIHARIGDAVTKGQLLMRIQSSDISQAFSDYRQALADDKLASRQLERSQLLYGKGAIAKKDVEVAEDAEAKAKVMVENTTERLRVLGADMSQPSALIEIHAPVGGIIIEQNVTAAGGVKSLDNSPNLFTIADTSVVWIICDVFENDMATVHVGEYADIHINAYPNRVLKGRISSISPVMDPNIRTAKVRLEVENPDNILRFGMFVTATFHGMEAQRRATVPAPAVLHLHDRDWVYVPAEDGRFRRVEVVGGKMLPGGLQEIVSGIKPGQQVVSRALIFQNTTEQ
jgi:cobalt-zinc-cadmium efflux system membrane fusion protein